MMSDRRVGAAVVTDPGALRHRHPHRARHPRLQSAPARTRTPSWSPRTAPTDVVFASPDWTLEQAAAAMVAGDFRHLVVVDGAEVTGLLSMRDIVRCWVGAAAGIPAQARA